MKTLDDIQFEGRRVLVRVDFNVPIDEDKNITDDIRIRTALPTIKRILKKNGRLILCSHMGRPKGERNEAFSLAPVVKHLANLLDKQVTLAPDCTGDTVFEMTSAMENGDIILLENLRFHRGETENDGNFAGELARLADVYINDAFAVSHHAHASVVGVAEQIEEKAAGLLLQKELDYFAKSMHEPLRPLAALVGGAKVSSKLAALENMLKKVDKMIIGGAMANTFLKSMNVNMGASRVEDDLLDTAKSFITAAEKKGVKLYFPIDFVAADSFAPTAITKNVTFQDIPANWMALDIGPATTCYFKEALSDAGTIVWNGPMGAFEMDAFARGTMELCRAVGQSNALSITGGGDSNAAVKKSGEQENITYMSTGGGAFLMLMEGKELPGVLALG